MNCHRLLAMGLAVVVVLSALAPLGTVAADEDAAELDVAVTQDDEPIVTVTHNGSAVAGANVSVSTAADEPGDEADSTNDTEDDNDSSDDAYAGVGHYTTDENGTVALPEPETTVVVHVTASADNASGSTTTKLTSDDGENESDAFGATVSAMVSDYQDDENVTLGLALASFVVSNNPGNAPGHAGPPAHAGLSGDDNETAGPPAHAGGSNETDGEEDGNASDDGGPPEHAGGPDDGNETDDGDSGGPPDHAGGPGDDTDDSDSEDDDEDDEADDEDE